MQTGFLQSLKDIFTRFASNDNAKAYVVDVSSMPVVTSIMEKPEVRKLHNFLQGLRKADHATLAADEAARLQPYFDKMSKYLLRHDGAKGLETILSPAGLRQAFNLVSAATGNLILSNVVVAPQRILKSKYAAPPGRIRLISLEQEFRTADDSLVSFDFWQVYGAKKKSSISLGTLRLASKQLQPFSAAELRPLLEDIQQMMQIVNHDVLHHFTMSVLNTRITARFKDFMSTPFMLWKARDDANGGYECFVHILHEKILLDDPQTLQDMRDISSRFVEKLKKLPDAVPYMSDVMAHCMSRLLPLDHAILRDFLAAVYPLDPGAASVIADGLKGIKLKHDSIQVVRDYAAAGVNFRPTTKNSASDTYIKTKLLRLINMSTRDTQFHAPVHKKSDIGYSIARKNNLQYTFDWFRMMQDTPIFKAALEKDAGTLPAKTPRAAVLG